MADRIFPYGEAPDNAEYVVLELNPDLPNAKELLAGTGISIAVGANTVTISGDGSSAQTYITANDETGTLPNSFQIIEGSNVTLDYVGNQLIISASVSGTGGGTVTIVNSGNANPLFTTNVTTATSTPTIAYTLNSAASGTFFSGPASGVAGAPSYRGILGTDLTGALEAGTGITLVPATAPGSRLTINAYGFQPLNSTLNALSSSLSGTGYITQIGPDSFAERTLTGTSNRITITNPAGIAGNSVFDVGSDVYTISSSNVLNDLASSTSTGIVVQSDSVGHHVYRTITGTSNEVTVTNGNGVSANPTLGLASGIDATKIADGSVTSTEFQYINTLSSNAQTQLDNKQPLDATLTALAGFNSNGFVVQTAADTFTSRDIEGFSGQVTVTNGSGVGANPVVSLASGILSALATGVSSVSAGNLNPIFTTNVATPTTTPAISYTLQNVASGIFLAGPASGGDGPWIARGILGTDLTGALQAGSNITITQATEPGSRLIISSTGGAGGYATVQEEGSNLTQRSTLNFVGGGVTAADDAGNSRTNVTLDSTLNSLAAYNTDGLLTQTAADTFTGRTITGTANRVSVSQGNGVSGNPTLDVGSDVYTISSSNVLNDLASSTSTGIVVQTDSIGHHAYRTLTGTANEITVTNGNGVSANPTFSLPTGIDVTKLADGSVTNTEFQYINTLSSNAQTQLDGKLVSAGDRDPLFTTSEAAGNISFALIQQASATFFCGPASGANADPTFRGILGTDLAGALQAGSNITLTPSTAPGSRIIIASSGGSGYSTVEEEGSAVTQRTTLNFVGAALTASDVSSKTQIATHTSVNSIAVTPSNGQIPIGNGTNFTVNEIDAGTGITVTNGSGTISIATKRTVLKRKAATTTRTNTATVADDPDLLFPVAANEIWGFISSVQWVTSSNTPDFKFTFSGPSGSTVTFAGVRQANDGAISAIPATSGGSTISYDVSGNQLNVLTVSGTITNGSTAGNLALQWSQNTSGAGNTSVNAGSYLHGTEE